MCQINNIVDKKQPTNQWSEIEIRKVINIHTIQSQNCQSNSLSTFNNDQCDYIRLNDFEQIFNII